MQSTSPYPTRLDYLRSFCFSFNVVQWLPKNFEPLSLHNALSVRWVMTLEPIVIILLADFSSGSAQICKYPLCIAWPAKNDQSIQRVGKLSKEGLGRILVVWDEEWWFGKRDGLGWGMVVWLDMCLWCEKDYGFCNSPPLLVDTRQCAWDRQPFRRKYRGLVDVLTNLQLVRMHGGVGTRKIALYRHIQSWSMVVHNLWGQIQVEIAFPRVNWKTNYEQLVLQSDGVPPTTNILTTSRGRWNWPLILPNSEGKTPHTGHIEKWYR